MLTARDQPVAEGAVVDHILDQHFVGHAGVSKEVPVSVSLTISDKPRTKVTGQYMPPWPYPADVNALWCHSWDWCEETFVIPLNISKERPFPDPPMDVTDIITKHEVCRP